MISSSSFESCSFLISVTFEISILKRSGEFLSSSFVDKIGESSVIFESTTSLGEKNVGSSSINAGPTYENGNEFGLFFQQ